jgi:hypothetical protein
MAPKTTAKKSRGVSVDREVAAERREASESLGGRSGDLHKFAEGQTLCYLVPPGREDDPTPYLESEAHFSVGPKKRMVINLSALRKNAPILAAIKARGLEWDDCEEGWELMSETAEKSGDKRIKKTASFMFNIVVMGFRKSSRYDWEKTDASRLKPVPVRCGRQIYKGVSDLLFEYDDICNPDEAIFFSVNREGTGMETKYSVKVDKDTLREPTALDDDLWEKIEGALKPGGDCDIYKLLVGWVRTEDQIRGVISGDEAEEGEESEPPPKRRATAPASSRSRTRKAVLPEPEEEEEEEAMDDDESPNGFPADIATIKGGALKKWCKAQGQPDLMEAIAGITTASALRAAVIAFYSDDEIDDEEDEIEEEEDEAVADDADDLEAELKSRRRKRKAS